MSDSVHLGGTIWFGTEQLERCVPRTFLSSLLLSGLELSDTQVYEP